MSKEKFHLREYKNVIKDWSRYETLNKKQAIIAKCLDCCCYDRNEVKLSPCKSCPLYIWKEIYFNKRKEEDIMQDYNEEKNETNIYD